MTPSTPSKDFFGTKSQFISTFISMHLKYEEKGIIFYVQPYFNFTPFNIAPDSWFSSEMITRYYQIGIGFGIKFKL